jgi:F-type H+-transporting ATPase subunit alpha
MVIEEQVISILAGVRGYLDKIDVGDVRRFEEGVIAEIRDKHNDLLETIRAEGELSDETDKRLTSVIDGFAKSFA